MHTGSFRAGFTMENGVAVFQRGDSRILVKERWLEIRRNHVGGANDHLVLLLDRADALAIAEMVFSQMRN